jgi:hypothetical protein
LSQQNFANDMGWLYAISEDGGCAGGAGGKARCKPSVIKLNAHDEGSCFNLLRLDGEARCLYLAGGDRLKDAFEPLRGKFGPAET